MAEICLIFPPSVSSGFDRYYPAGPVLAAYLEQHGVRTEQRDLNAAFARHLLAPANLDMAGKGIFLPNTPPAPATMPAVAARVLARNRDMLFDRDGRSDFSNPESPAFLISALSKPYNIDCDLADLSAPSGTLVQQLAYYDAFFEQEVPENCFSDDTRLIGITVAMGPQLGPACRLARHLRERLPKVRILFGGPAISLLDEANLAVLFAAAPGVDAMVRFDGEAPLLALAQQAMAGHWDPGAVLNCVVPVGDGLCLTPLAPGPSLQTLPPARYEPAILAAAQDPEIGIVQARGCYWGKCAYCDFVELYGDSRRFRSRTATAVVDEIEHQLRANGVRRFALITEAIPPGFSMRFADLLIERDLKIRWDSFAMVDQKFTPDHFRRMAQSGCSHLVIGLETMVDRVLALVDKSARAADNLRFLRDAHDAGILLYVNLIPDLPSTTFEEAMEALALLETVRDCFASVSVFPFEATKSSEVGRNPQKFGLTMGMPSAPSGQAEFSANHLGAFDTAMTDDERRRATALYRAFAAKVNATNEQATDESMSAQSEPKSFRISNETVDIHRDEAGTHLFNWRMQQAWSAPIGVAALTAKLSESQFSRACFDALTGDADVSSHLWNTLDKMGVIEPVQP